MQNRSKTENVNVVIRIIVVSFSHKICCLNLVVSVKYSINFFVYFKLVILSCFVFVVLKDRKNIVRIVDLVFQNL